jgi:predicted KAP-like P-loop ATPase
VNSDARQGTSVRHDQPLSDPALDRFRRWPFAERIAATIAGLSDPASIAVGVYGPWGDGKTTVLNYIHEALAGRADIVTVRFNPWRFTDESQLIRSFFDTVAEALGKSLTGAKEVLGNLLSTYGGLLAAIPGVPGDAAAKIGQGLSTVHLDDLKERVAKVLRESGKRLVVLIDDIDRLDEAEIHALFKLIRLSADFDHTAYVLAFDEEIVAASLAGRYAGGRPGSGRDFIEKIVQVPLHLPPVDPTALRGLCFEGVDAALAQAEIQLEEDDVNRFVRHFVVGLETRLATPRMAKRYANALTFALPLLKGEVDPVDQLLVEGMRVFYPSLYEYVRRHPDVFLGTSAAGGQNNEPIRQRTQAARDEALAALNGREAAAASELLAALFPRFHGLLGNTTYSHHFDDIWAREQRVASAGYFARYFSYAIPPGDFPDRQIEEFLSFAATNPPETLADRVKGMDRRQRRRSIR